MPPRRRRRIWAGDRANLDHERVLEQLLENSWFQFAHFPDEVPSLLEPFPAAEQKSIWKEYLRRLSEKNYRERRATLLDRLRTWDVDRWHEVFGEQPELKRELTAEQQRRWRAWLASCKKASEPSVVEIKAESGDGR